MVYIQALWTERNTRIFDKKERQINNIAKKLLCVRAEGAYYKG